MLICPHCQFENPNSNKFCQSCGISLVHKVCPNCSTDVAIDSQQCHNCNTECGKTWLAIIHKLDRVAISSFSVPSPEQKQEQEQELKTVKNQLVVEKNSHNLAVGSFLDLQQRYKIISFLPRQEESTSTSENYKYFRVLDCQPYQVSPLEAKLENELGNKGVGNDTSPALKVEDISFLAQSYINLYPERHKGIPPVHDIWQQNELEFILIEDRSEWLNLVELWRADTTEPRQILDCFHQMIILWEILEPFNCHYSILDLTNLKLDEDQTIALQKLYLPLLSNLNSDKETSQVKNISPPTHNLTIRNLGRTWQTLFKKSQRTQIGAFVQLLGDIEAGKIETQLQLRSRLEAIALELQPSAGVTTSNPTILQLDTPEDTAVKNDDLPTIALPVELINLEDAGLTDVGRQRDHNEDYFGIETDISKAELPKAQTIGARGLYILCDGMGGHAGGEVASELAVRTLRKYFQINWGDELPSEEVIKQGIRFANQSIFDVNQKDARSGVGRMGTTLVMVLVQDNNLAVAHVGDSRLYRFTKKRGLEQITLDHEVGQREIARGVEPEDAYARPDAYQLTQALGPRDENFIAPEVKFLQIAEDALFILVSDGLSDNDLLEKYAQDYLRPLLKSEASLKKGARDLIDLANKCNGHDNITTILIRAKVGANAQKII
ncbi:MAG: serine/threonine phosphatase [Mastigocoleus sp.]